MNLDIAWSAPSPVPGCGYRALYRRKGDPSYTEIATSGTTLTVGVEAPASYEGRLVSDCCADSLSQGTPFGVNGYDALSVSVAYNPDTQFAEVTIVSAYASGYDTIIAGTVDIDQGGGPTPTQINTTYPAGSTSFTANITNVSPGSTFSNIDITAVSPVFNNGGQLQQYDAVNTPPYFKFYWDGDVSGTTWTGAPTELPSFTLDQFTPTEYAVDGITVLAGTLYMSYILPEVWPNSFNTLTIEVYDDTTALIGTTFVPKSPAGLRQASIALTKAISDLNTSTDFTMKILWPDLTLIDTKVFRLPTF